MILPDHLLDHLLRRGDIIVAPLMDGAIQPASIDVRLGPEIKLARKGFPPLPINLGNGPYLLHFGQFALGSTLETVWLPADISGNLAGKSARARRGLVLENAGWIDPGWQGILTLELFNFSPEPFLLEAGMPIGQIVFHQMAARAERPYGHPDLGSHYQHSTGTRQAHDDPHRSDR